MGQSGKYTSYQKGIWAEHYAEALLRLKGYRVLARRYKTPFGEIDLVAQKRQVLVAVEVKFRGNSDQAIEAVNLRSQKRIIAAADFFCSHHNALTTYDVRFDIITVTPSFFIHHHQNAWYA